MSYHKDLVFLLRSTDYRDSDIIVNLLSQTEGLLSAIIYGGKKIGGRNSFTYTSGDLIELEYQTQENREFIKIINLQGMVMLQTDRFSYKRFLFHCYLLELIVKIVKPGKPGDDIMELLEANQRLDWSKNSQQFICRSLWQLIYHGGFDMEINQCLQCGRESFRRGGEEILFRKENYRLEEYGGGIICKQCLGTIQKSRTLTPSMIKILSIYQYESHHIRYEINAPIETLNPLIHILNTYLLNHFEIRPKSLDMFLQSIDSI